MLQGKKKKKGRKEERKKIKLNKNENTIYQLKKLYGKSHKLKKKCYRSLPVSNGNMMAKQEEWTGVFPTGLPDPCEHTCDTCVHSTHVACGGKSKGGIVNVSYVLWTLGPR